MTTIVVFGGYGTFGARVSRGLAARGHRVVVAGRDLARASALARVLEGAQAAAADLRDPASCRAVLAGAKVAVVCGGPFSDLDTTAARAALEEGAHYVDIADDRGYVRRLRRLHDEFARGGLCAAFGCSSLPALSSALGLSLLGDGPPPRRARVTLFIGNANPKGEASVRAMVSRLGGSDGTRGPAFGQSEVVPMPAPFGPRRASTFETVDLDLLPALLGVASVEVRVGFELAVVNAVLERIGAMRVRWGRRAGTLLSRAAAVVPRFGSSGGAVRVELDWPDGASRARSLVADEEGQRMAALPCVEVADALAGNGPHPAGVRPPTDVVAATALLAEMEKAGLRMVEG